MGIKVTTQFDRTKDLLAACKQLDNKRIEVGALEGEHAWLVGIHEHGLRIKVTDKMRAFLHHNGIHLRPGKTEIVIPERSFLRSGFDDNIDAVTKKVEKMLKSVMAGNLDVDKFLEGIGLLLSSKIKTHAAKRVNSPANVWTNASVDSPLAKKSSNPLVDSGNMLEAISFKIEG